jgi:hypothetical protein
MKVLKGFLRFILVVVAIVLIFAIVIVCTYVLGSPNTDTGTDSRSIVSGPWTEVVGDNPDAELYKFDFNQSGEFKIVKGTTQIADGWFKIDEKSHKIKLLMLPNHYTEDFAPYVNYKVLSEVSFSNLTFQLKKAEFGKDPEVIKDKEPSVSFLIREAGKAEGGGETLVMNCKMYEYTLDLYASEHDLTRDA